MKSQKGFTLIEIAIVFVIIAVLLSYTFMPLRSQIETAHIKQARAKLVEIEESLYGFAIANNRLPCPTQPGLNGLSNPPDPTLMGTPHCNNNTNIAGYIGFVPSATLGIKGKVNCDGLLIDPWGRPYMYSVSHFEDPVLNQGSIVVTGGIAAAGGPNNITVASNQLLKVCNDLTENCNGGAGSYSADVAYAVIFSMGNRQIANSTDENENAGEGAAKASTCGLPAYEVGGDRFYYSAERLEQAGQEFDDIVIWISPNILFAKLLQAGHNISP